MNRSLSSIAMFSVLTLIGPVQSAAQTFSPPSPAVIPVSPAGVVTVNVTGNPVEIPFLTSVVYPPGQAPWLEVYANSCLGSYVAGQPQHLCIWFTANTTAASRTATIRIPTAAGSNPPMVNYIVNQAASQTITYSPPSPVNIVASPAGRQDVIVTNAPVQIPFIPTVVYPQGQAAFLDVYANNCLGPYVAGQPQHLCIWFNANTGPARSATIKIPLATGTNPPTQDYVVTQSGGALQLSQVSFITGNVKPETSDPWTNYKTKRTTAYNAVVSQGFKWLDAREQPFWKIAEPGNVSVSTNASSESVYTANGHTRAGSYFLWYTPAAGACQGKYFRVIEKVDVPNNPNQFQGRWYNGGPVINFPFANGSYSYSSWTNNEAGRLLERRNYYDVGLFLYNEYFRIPASEPTRKAAALTAAQQWVDEYIASPLIDNGCVKDRLVLSQQHWAARQITLSSVFIRAIELNNPGSTLWEFLDKAVDNLYYTWIWQHTSPREDWANPNPNLAFSMTADLEREAGFTLLYGAYLAKYHPTATIRDKWMKRISNKPARIAARQQAADGNIWIDISGTSASQGNPCAPGTTCVISSPLLYGALIESFIAINELNKTVNPTLATSIRDIIKKYLDYVRVNQFETHQVPKQGGGTVACNSLVDKSYRQNGGPVQKVSTCGDVYSGRSWNNMTIGAYGWLFKETNDLVYKTTGETMFGATFGGSGSGPYVDGQNSNSLEELTSGPFKQVGQGNFTSVKFLSYILP